MKVLNIHERKVTTVPETVGALIDSLSGTGDQLWPRDQWPPMEFDAPLGKGAQGGHGPVRYTVYEYVPGERVVFRFDNSGLIAGFDGRHLFEIVPRREHVLLRHVIDAECDFKHWLKWHVFVGPLHDALLEDSLDLAEQSLNIQTGKRARWSPWVRFLRWMMARRRRKSEGDQSIT